MVVFREANEYSGTPKCAYYVATMNSCEGSGHTSAFQCGAHQVPPRGVFVTAGREVFAAFLSIPNTCWPSTLPCGHVLGQPCPRSRPGMPP